MKYRYWFACAKGGNVCKRKLLDYFGHAKRIWHADEEDIRNVPDIPTLLLNRILNSRRRWDIDREYEKLNKSGVLLVTLEDDGYPKLIKQIHDAPYGLFYKGTLPRKDEKMVAMVGARQPSGYGGKMAAEIAKKLAGSGISIVSGMALGVDGFSHRGAIMGGGRTYAFLGCGADVCYPKRHFSLYEEIIKNGAVFSEYVPGTMPQANLFPARNRLIAGMCKGCIIVEAKRRSGSLITADFALEQGRDVFAVPGRIGDPLSEGTNRLIAQGAAPLLDTEELISELFGEMNTGGEDRIFFDAKKFHLEKEELLVYSCFDFYAKGIDAVQAECKLALSELIPVIIRLCNYGLIREIFKNQYIRIA